MVVVVLSSRATTSLSSSTVTDVMSGRRAMITTNVCYNVTTHREWKVWRPIWEMCAPFYGTFDYMVNGDGSATLSINTVPYARVEHEPDSDTLKFIYFHSNR